MVTKPGTLTPCSLPLSTISVANWVRSAKALSTTIADLQRETKRQHKEAKARWRLATNAVGAIGAMGGGGLGGARFDLEAKAGDLEFRNTLGWSLLGLIQVKSVSAPGLPGTCCMVFLRVHTGT